MRINKNVCLILEMRMEREDQNIQCVEGPAQYYIQSSPSFRFNENRVQPFIKWRYCCCKNLTVFRLKIIKEIMAVSCINVWECADVNVTHY